MVSAKQPPSDSSKLHFCNKSCVIDIDKIRRDGRTQGRVSLNVEVVREYALLLETGVDLPPVRIWFDGEFYWLTDGFHRVAAAEQVGSTKITAEVLRGNLTDAQWDSYGSNTNHGLRRSKADLEAVIGEALAHPNARQLSNCQIARHLCVPEATLRRWRKRASSPCDEDARIALRNGTTYTIKTGNIGRSSHPPRVISRSRTGLREGLAEMKSRASPQAQRMLNAISNWVFAGSTTSDCLSAIENVLHSSEAPDRQGGPA